MSYDVFPLAFLNTEGRISIDSAYLTMDELRVFDVSVEDAERLRQDLERAIALVKTQKRVGGAEIGQKVTCTVCGLRKKPRGRDAPPVIANSLCDFECPGYNQPPEPGD